MLSNLISIANAIAKAFGGSGLEKVSGSVSSSIGEVADGTENIVGGFDEATASAKKLNKTIAGFDELNVLNSSTGKGGIGAGVGVSSGNGIITEGTAAPNTGIPGEVGGYTRERLVSASADGIMEPLVQIGDLVQKGQIVAKTGGISVTAKMSGIVRGMLQKGVEVKKGPKIGDIDARPDRRNCFLISDKARIIGKSVCSIVETKKIKEHKK